MTKEELHPALEEYATYDHSHCWQSKNPPCGQKIEHLKCCLCEELNPFIKQELAKAEQRGRDDAVDYVTIHGSPEWDGDMNDEDKVLEGYSVSLEVLESALKPHKK